MKITSTTHAMREDLAGVPARQTITIEIEPGDDEIGLINGLILRGRLEAALRVWGRPSDLGDPADDGDLQSLMVGLGSVQDLTDARAAALMWAARDTYAWSWGQIAGAFDNANRATVRRRVARTRHDHAEGGYYRDADGIHHTDPDTARARAEARAAEVARRTSD